MPSPTDLPAPTTAEKLRWLLFGTLLTFVVFEGGLRLIGSLMDRGMIAGSADARYTILCDGDSFTYGIGGRSFPDQLEKVLSDRHGAGIVRTVNEGLPGLNSALLADRFEHNLRTHKPDVALIIVGENNSWNSVRLIDPQGALAWTDHLDRALLHSRVYKFAKVWWVGASASTFHEAGNPALDPVQQAANYMTETREVIGYPDDEPEVRFTAGPGFASEPWDRGQAAKARGDYPAAIEAFTEVTHMRPAYNAGWFELGISYMRVGELDAAIGALNAAKALEPAVPDVFFSLGHAYERRLDVDDAVRVWVEGLQHWPKSRKLYRSMAARLYVERRLWESLDRVAHIEGIEENLLHQYLLRLRERQGDDVEDLVSAGLESDVRDIVRTARKYGVHVVFGSYPDASYPVIEQTAREEGASYIDFRPAFIEHFPSRESYLSADRCHCNTEGYALMAGIFADEVERVLGL